MSSWDFVKRGQYSEAIDAFSEEISTSPTVLLFNNRGMAYLHVGDYDAALSEFQAADEISSAETLSLRTGDMIGVAYWMSGRKDDALVTWVDGVNNFLEGKVKYTDAAGGVTIGNLGHLHRSRGVCFFGHEVS